jgi:hypothetical protein
MDYLAEITAEVIAKDPSGEKTSISCTAPLLGAGLSFSEAKTR